MTKEFFEFVYGYPPKEVSCILGGEHEKEEGWFYAYEGSYYHCKKCGADLGVARTPESY